MVQISIYKNALPTGYTPYELRLFAAALSCSASFHEALVEQIGACLACASTDSLTLDYDPSLNQLS